LKSRAPKDSCHTTIERSGQYHFIPVEQPTFFVEQINDFFNYSTTPEMQLLFFILNIFSIAEVDASITVFNKDFVPVCIFSW